MAVVVELPNTGGIANRSDIVASIEHDWEMKIEGPRGFEQMYTLIGNAGEHQPEVIRSVLSKLLSGRPGLSKA